jgi:hypothetical protein
MSDFSDARTLRLERLESRSLLAGGVFDFALTTGNVESDHLHPKSHHLKPQNDSFRPHEVARNVPRSARIEAPPTRQAPPQQSQSVQNASASDANEAIAVAPVRTTTPASSPSPPTTPQSQGSSRQPSAIDAAIASLASETSSEANADSALAQPTGEVSTIESATSSRIVVTETFNVQRENAFLPTVSDSPSAADDGLIDLAPFESFEPSTNNADASEPWELGRQTIPLLRQIAQHAVGDRAEPVDQMMQDWFNGPGGLIALDQVNLPAIAFPLDSVMIDVGLESTVALHRSLNLVASSVTPALSGRALDAIMASLEQVAASETQPVIEPSPLRIPTAAYPVVAVVATTIAVSARRKHKHPQSNLQFTDGQ